MKRVYIGTSGWSYKSWQASFYPARIPVRDYFRFYATQFRTVEINLTFYRLPTIKMVTGWSDAAPEGFVFAVKGSRCITHLETRKIAHVSLSSQRMPANLTATSQIVYIRFHGLAGGAAHDYTRSELKPWVNHIHDQARSGRTVFAFFNNDANERAPANAKLLMTMVGEEAEVFARAA